LIKIRILKPVIPAFFDDHLVVPADFGFPRSATAPASERREATSAVHSVLHSQIYLEKRHSIDIVRGNTHLPARLHTGDDLHLFVLTPETEQRGIVAWRFIEAKPDALYRFTQRFGR
jgi:hypothetical protein